MITKKMTTFCSDTPLIKFKEEELQNTRGRGVGTSPLCPHQAWGDLIMKGLWDWALLRTCYVIQLPLSCLGCRFAASRNSCFEITSVVSHFSSPTPPLPFLYMPQSNPLLLAVASEAQFIQTRNNAMQTLAVCSDVRPSQTLYFNSSLNVSSSVWHWVFIATGAWYCRSLPP